MQVLKVFIIAAMFVLSVAGAARAQVAPQRVPFPVAENLRLFWDFDRSKTPAPLDRFEVAVDDLAFVETVPLQVGAETYQARIPTMTAGLHTIYVRGCSATTCWPETGLLVLLDDGSAGPPPTDPLPRVRNLGIGVARSPE